MQIPLADLLSVNYLNEFQVSTSLRHAQLNLEFSCMPSEIYIVYFPKENIFIMIKLFLRVSFENLEFLNHVLGKNFG